MTTSADLTTPSAAPASPGRTRLVFFGTAPLGIPCLTALVRESAAYSVLAVVSQPDRPRGRDLRLQPTPIKAAALALGLPVLQPARCRDTAFVGQLHRLQPDLIVVVAYGQLLPPALLELPPLGCLNLHASLLPRHRGAAPIQWALLEGDTQTGVTLMKIDAGLDTGAVLAQVTTPIHPDDTAQTLHDRLASLGAALLIQALPEYLAGRLPPRPQPSVGVTYARKLTREDGRLDWSLPAVVLERRVRALTPWPGAYTFLPTAGPPVLLKIWAASVVPAPLGEPGQVLAADATGLVVRCGTDALRVTELQRAGGRRLRVAEFLAGHSIASGTRLGTT